MMAKVDHQRFLARGFETTSGIRQGFPGGP